MEYHDSVNTSEISMNRAMGYTYFREYRNFVRRV